MSPVKGAGKGAGADAPIIGSASDSSDRWARLKAVFLDALAYAESDQSAFVGRACGADVDLREEILSLLASERAAGSFGETPAARLLDASAPADPLSAPRLEPGARLGAYEVTAFLSAGGMGEVYRARHTVLNRVVAVKTVGARLPDPGMRTF